MTEEASDRQVAARERRNAMRTRLKEIKMAAITATAEEKTADKETADKETATIVVTQQQSHEVSIIMVTVATKIHPMN